MKPTDKLHKEKRKKKLSCKQKLKPQSYNYFVVASEYSIKSSGIHVIKLYKLLDI